MILEVANNRTCIYGASYQELHFIDVETKYPSDLIDAIRGGFKPPPEEGEGWDGWIHLLRCPKLSPPWFPTGLLPRVQKICAKMSIPVEIYDRRLRPVEGFPEFTINKQEIIDREYQLKAADQAVRVGRGVLDMPARSGKTRTMCEIHRRIALPTLWLAPTDRIVRQTHDVLEGFFGANYVTHLIGTKTADEAANCRVVVCTAATAARLSQEFYKTREVLVVDEFHHCLSATTGIWGVAGKVEISAISPGDLVWTRGAEDCLELRPVLRVWRRTAPSRMLRIVTSSGVLEITDEHGIYTRGTKVRARELRIGRTLQVLQMRQDDYQKGPVCSACEGLRWDQGSAALAYQSDGEEVSKQGLSSASFGADEGREKPFEARRGSGEDQTWLGRLAQSAIWAWNWWKGQWRDAIGRLGKLGAFAVGFPERVQAVDWPKEGAGTRNLVFSGFCPPQSESRGGGGWQFASESKGCRRPEGCFSAESGVVRDSRACSVCGREFVLVEGVVESIEVIEAPGPSVYDLEVEGNHNYFAEGVLVSNSAAKSYNQDIFSKCDHIYYRFGMTGTFFRSGLDEMAMHALLSTVIYKVTAKELVDLGFLVPTRAVFLPVKGPRLRGMPDTSFQRSHGKYGIQDHHNRNELVTMAAVKLWQFRKRVLVLVGTKIHGRKLRDMIQTFVRPAPSGCRFKSVEFISTDTDRSIQGEIIDSFLEHREVKILIGTSLLGEGTDLPAADALVYARGQQASVSVTQNAYRVCTATPGKREAIIVDFADRHNKYLLQHSLERLRIYYEEPTFSVEVLEDVTNFWNWMKKSGT